MTLPDRPQPYAFGIQHCFDCKALYDWNDIEASSCTCGAYDYGLETGRCSDHEYPLTEDGKCFLCMEANK